MTQFEMSRGTFDPLSIISRLNTVNLSFISLWYKQMFLFVLFVVFCLQKFSLKDLSLTSHALSLRMRVTYLEVNTFCSRP